MPPMLPIVSWPQSASAPLDDHTAAKAVRWFSER